MSVGEMIGLLLATGVVGGAVGAAVTTALVGRRRAAEDCSRQQVDVLGRWLAARITLGRVSASFVAAFRSLAAEPTDSDYFSLRTEEAQRARTQWCEAVGELDLAEASLRAWIPSSLVDGRNECFERVSAEVLRVAIDGKEPELDRLMKELQSADRSAAKFVEETSAILRPPPPWMTGERLLGRLALQVRRIVGHWARG